MLSANLGNIITIGSLHLLHKIYEKLTRLLVTSTPSHDDGGSFLNFWSIFEASHNRKMNCFSISDFPAKTESGLFFPCISESIHFLHFWANACADFSAPSDQHYHCFDSKTGNFGQTARRWEAAHTDFPGHRYHLELNCQCLSCRAPNVAKFAHLWCTTTDFHPLEVCPVHGVDLLNLLVKGVFTL